MTDGKRSSGELLVSDHEFSLFQTLIYREAGIFLSDSKRALLAGRLAKRLRELQLPSLAAYYRVVQARGEKELTYVLDSITTNETHFFREPKQFELLSSRVCRDWKASADAGRRNRIVRVWSAGCSTGEEPYSLAMMLLDLLPSHEGWSVEILATDLSTRVLERAREGVWPMSKTAEIPQPYLKAYMLRGVNDQEGKLKAGPEIRSVIRFARVNLNEAAGYPAGPFDLVFCRNVLIYFNAESKTGVVNRLFAVLAPAGLLFLGHAESLSGVTGSGKTVIPSVYARADQQGDRTRASIGRAVGLTGKAA